MISANAERLAAKLEEERIHRGAVWSEYYNARRARRPMPELDALADELVRANATVHDLVRDLSIQERRDEINSTTIDKFQAESKSSARS